MIMMMMVKLGDGILIANSVVPAIETTNFALFSVSFFPQRLVERKQSSMRVCNRLNYILFGYCKCSSEYF